ncbi:MAG: hypothetical protein WA628_19705, partial [Terriglobales bacterium]
YASSTGRNHAPVVVLMFWVCMRSDFNWFVNYEGLTRTKMRVGGSWFRFESMESAVFAERFMTKRAVRIVKHLGPVPCVAACTACGRQFTAPLSTLARVTDAQANLQEQFEQHRCESEKSGGA